MVVILWGIWRWFQKSIFKALTCLRRCLSTFDTESELHLLTTQWANKSGDEVSGQGIKTLFGKPADREDDETVIYRTTSGSYRTISLGSGCSLLLWNKEGGRWRGKVERSEDVAKISWFWPDSGRTCVNFFFPAAIHEWIWSGCFPWPKQRHLRLMLSHAKQGSQRWAIMNSLSYRQYSFSDKPIANMIEYKDSSEIDRSNMESDLFFPIALCIIFPSSSLSSFLSTSLKKKTTLLEYSWLYSVALLSALQQSESAIHTHVFPLFWISFSLR